MMAPRRLGIVASPGMDVQRWLKDCQLSQQFTVDWKQLALPSEVDHQLDGLVWLWAPSHTEEEQRLQSKRWQQYLTAMNQRCRQVLPIIIVTTEELLNDDTGQGARDELKQLVKQLRKSYQRDRQGWVPAELVDRARITMHVNDAAGGERLLSQMNLLMQSQTRWQEKSQRQAERCLAVGVLLAAAYFTLLFTTMYWKPAKVDRRSADPLAWVKADWQYHLQDAQQMLFSIGKRGLAELTAPELQRFNEHLRWLPVSLDLLKQRRPTKETLQLRAGVEQLLSSMESLVTTWTSTPAISLLELTAQQLRAQQLLDGVFEPRPPPTALHQAAQRYWLQERRLTMLQLKSASPQTGGGILSILQQRLTSCDNARIHAPELKAAWLQELTSTLQWIEKTIAQPDKKWSDESLPTLLKESGVKPQ